MSRKGNCYDNAMTASATNPHWCSNNRLRLQLTQTKTMKVQSTLSRKDHDSKKPRSHASFSWPKALHGRKLVLPAEHRAEGD
jgi:hypothetical protein